MVASVTRERAKTSWPILLGWALTNMIASRSQRTKTATRARPSGPPQRGRAPQNAHRAGASTRADGRPQAQEDRTDAEQGRGREAGKPTDIPARGWKDIFWRVYERFGKDRVASVAAGVTFYALLAIFPAIAALVSIYGLFADPNTMESHVNALSGVLPGGAVEIVGGQIRRLAGQGGGALGLGFAIGLATSLWSANAGMKAVFDALNIVYNEDEKRSFFALNAQSLTFTLGAILFLLLALGAVVVIPAVLDFIGLGPIAETLIAILRWPLLLAGVVLGLALIYRYGPSRDNPQWRWLTTGSIVAAVLWIVGSMLFSWYVANFGSYNETYGSLGAAIGFMTWIWLSTIIVLLGAEINAETEHQTAEDTTQGQRQPLGARGATMADTVGEAKS